MVKDKSCKWHFAQSLGGQDQGPNDAMGENFKKDPFESLVRESIQNSLDASLDNGKPVVMSFKFKHLNYGDFPQLFALKDHMIGCLDLYDDSSAHKKFDPMLAYLENVRNSMVDYLEVSDHNTTGMDYVKGNTKSGFYSFVKSAGNSSKPNASAGGSFGFGKAAYFNVSKLRTILISTKTQEGKYFFEGVSSLCTHNYNGQKRVPVGFYCVNDDEEPVSNENDIPSSFVRCECGTSMFIMGLGLGGGDLKNAVSKIMEATIRHFWMAILRGKLEVRIGIEDKYMSINEKNLQERALKIFPDFDDLHRGHKNPRPYIEAVANVNKDSNHMVFQEKIEVLGNVEFYLLRCKTGNDYILNMRSPLMLVNHQLNGSKYGFYSVFVCTDKKGNELLRMAENPAHNEWDLNNAPDQDKGNVNLALEARKNFIKKCILSQFVSSEDETITFGGLDEFLTIPTDIIDQDYHPDFGKPNGEESEDESGSTTTKIDDGDEQEPKKPTMGKVKIRKPKKRKSDIEGGGGQPTGHTPENDPNKDDNHGGDGDSGGGNHQPRKPLDNDQPEIDMSGDDDGEPFTNHDPLNVSYRAFAQSGPNGIEHHLVIHSNRAASNVVIGVLVGGENDDERLDIAYSNNGSLAGNQLSKIKLVQGKNEIIIRFYDNMRHAIKLSIYENQ